MALNLLTELAENKVGEFDVAINESYRTAGTTENRTAPITSVVAVYHDYRAYVKDDASKIVTEFRAPSRTLYPVAEQASSAV